MEVRPDRKNSTQFLPGSGCIDTTIWIAATWDAKLKQQKKKLDGQITQECLRAILKQVPGGPTPPQDTNYTGQIASHHEKLYKLGRNQDTQGHCWRSKDELISDVLLWDPPHMAKTKSRDGPARTYIQQFM